MKAGQGARGVRCQGRLVGLVVELVSHLEPGEPGEAVRAGVSLAAFTARLPVGTCKALGSWQPWRTPDELICTFTVAGVTCNVGETWCHAVYPRPAGTVLLWPCRQGLGWEDRTGRTCPLWSSHPWVGGERGWGSYLHLRTSGGWAVAGGPSSALPLTPSQPHLSILSVHEPLGTRRSPGSPHFLLLLSGRTENLRGRPTRTACQLSPGPAVCFPRGKVYSCISQPTTTTPCPTAAQALSERHRDFLFVATASRAGKTCEHL